MCMLESSRYGLKYLTPATQWKPSLNSRLSTSAWLSHGCFGCWENEPTDGRSVYFCLSFSNNSKIKIFLKIQFFLSFLLMLFSPRWHRWLLSSEQWWLNFLLLSLAWGDCPIAGFLPTSSRHKGTRMLMVDQPFEATDAGSWPQALLLILGEEPRVDSSHCLGTTSYVFPSDSPPLSGD